MAAIGGLHSIYSTGNYAIMKSGLTSARGSKKLSSDLFLSQICAGHRERDRIDGGWQVSVRTAQCGLTART
jgi:hypothetical protein